MDEATISGRSRADEPQRSRPGVILAIAVASLAAHCIGWTYIGYDVGRWLLPWYGHIIDQGPLGAFAAPFSNYTPPYLYLLSAVSLLDGLLSPVTLIKLLSVAGTGALALATYYLLGPLGVQRRGEKACLIFLLPTTLLNAPVLAQCDAMWAAVAVAALAESVRRRPAAVLAWCGLALALKLQAVFLAPFVVAWLLAERVRPQFWLIPPAVYCAAMAPAWLLGWPASHLATIYLRQSQYFNTIGNASNPWIFATGLDPQALQGLIWAGCLAGLIAAAVYIWSFSRHRFDPARLVPAALLSAMLLPFILPKMHERYFFLADILALIYAWTARTREAAMIAVAVQASSILAVTGYFLRTPFFAMIGCLLLILALVAVARDLLPANERGGAGRLLST